MNKITGFKMFPALKAAAKEAVQLGIVKTMEEALRVNIRETGIGGLGSNHVKEMPGMPKPSSVSVITSPPVPSRKLAHDQFPLVDFTSPRLERFERLAQAKVPANPKNYSASLYANTKVSDASVTEEPKPVDEKLPPPAEQIAVELKSPPAGEPGSKESVSEQIHSAPKEPEEKSKSEGGENNNGAGDPLNFMVASALATVMGFAGCALHKKEAKPEVVVESEGAKPEEVKPEEVKPEEVKPEEVKPEEVKREETKPEEKEVETVIVPKKREYTPLIDTEVGGGAMFILTGAVCTLGFAPALIGGATALGAHFLYKNQERIQEDVRTIGKSLPADKNEFLASVQPVVDKVIDQETKNLAVIRKQVADDAYNVLSAAEPVAKKVTGFIGDQFAMRTAQAKDLYGYFFPEKK